MEQDPLDQVYRHTGCSCSSSPMQDLEGQGTGWWAGRPIHPSKSPHTLLREAVETYGQRIIWHTGTQLMLGQRRQLVLRNLVRVSTLRVFWCEGGMFLGIWHLNPQETTLLWVLSDGDYGAYPLAWVKTLNMLYGFTLVLSSILPVLSHARAISVLSAPREQYNHKWLV